MDSATPSFPLEKFRTTNYLPDSVKKICNNCLNSLTVTIIMFLYVLTFQSIFPSEGNQDTLLKY